MPTLFLIITIITEIIITPTTGATRPIIIFQSIGGFSVGLLDVGLIEDVTCTESVDAGLVGDMVFPVDNGLFV